MLAVGGGALLFTLPSRGFPGNSVADNKGFSETYRPLPPPEIPDRFGPADRGQGFPLSFPPRPLFVPLCPYLPSCREGVFSETELPVLTILGNSRTGS
jgi:hypothetical protein